MKTAWCWLVGWGFVAGCVGGGGALSFDGGATNDNRGPDAGGEERDASGGDDCLGSTCAEAGPAKDAARTCAASGAGCNNGTDCCSNRCVDGVCDPCAMDGQSCGALACCVNAASTLTCAKGTCSTCRGAGAACNDTSECCSKACTGGTCEAPPLCAPISASCSVAGDCCGGEPCVSGKCGCTVGSLLTTKVPGVPSPCVAPIEQCCADATPCLNDAGCTTLVNCLIGCLGDLACRATCSQNANANAKALSSAFAACMSANGAGACVP